MLNPIRNRIPGCDEHPHLAELERQDMQKAIALDALRRLPVAAALTVVDAYVEGLSGATADPRRLMKTGNVICRRADRIDSEGR